MADTFSWNCEEVTDYGPCGFQTSNWPSQKLADERGAEHMQEHETGEPMRELADFELEKGLR